MASNKNFKKPHLEKCPHCGGEATVHAVLSGNSYDSFAEIICLKCGASSKRFDISLEYCAVDMAAENWNQRYKEE